MYVPISPTRDPNSKRIGNHSTPTVTEARMTMMKLVSNFSSSPAGYVLKLQPLARNERKNIHSNLWSTGSTRSEKAQTKKSHWLGALNPVHRLGMGSCCQCRLSCWARSRCSWLRSPANRSNVMNHRPQVSAATGHKEERCKKDWN